MAPSQAAHKETVPHNQRKASQPLRCPRCRSTRVEPVLPSDGAITIHCRDCHAVEVVVALNGSRSHDRPLDTSR